MSSVLQELVGKKVSVYSAHTPVADIGVLEAADQTWIRLRKSESEVLFFSVYQVRMIKPFQP